MDKRAEKVEYLSCSYIDGDFVFKYAIDGRDLTINLAHSKQSVLPLTSIEQIGFNIGMCYLMDLAEIVMARHISIYKHLPPLALNYWVSLYDELVIEKCYALKIPLSSDKVIWDFAESSSDELATKFNVNSSTRDHAALCLTGGKESLAILKTLEATKPLLLFFLDPEPNVHRQRVYESVKDANLTVKTISNRLELFKPLQEEYQGLQSGVDMAHLVFNTMLYADVCEYVLIGNEFSSNYPNDIYEGEIVNHQFVKTIHFAKNLNSYIHDYVTEDFTYYSPFFEIYEYKIADLLFKDDKYLDIWTSCNQTTPEINFCSNCYKCAFTYLIARLKKPDDYLSKFFSRNMLDDVTLFKPMMDFVGKKPLDCVGDKTEVWVALESLMQAGVSNQTVDYYVENIRPLIINVLEDFKAQVTSFQRVPVSFPEDIKSTIYSALESASGAQVPA